jgi:hypothetical protein
MAKGTLVFEFESALDLENQMRAYLRLPLLKEVTLGEAEQAPDTARGALGEMGNGMTFSASSLTASPMAGKTASGITEEVRKLNQEAAEVLVGADAPVAEKVETVPASEQNVPTLTLETLATAPYPELLAFCEHTPAVGVDVSKCQASFFRKLVEMKIKAYLETK